MLPMSVAGYEDVAHVGLSLALGLIVGLQRGWAARLEAEGSRFAGIRTFGLLGLAGGVAGVVSAQSQPLATTILIATAGLILIGYWQTVRNGGSVSGTGSIVGLLTLACGFLATAGSPMEATVIAVSMVVVLAMRSQLHRLVGRMSEAEVAAVARFALIALVILPLLPDRPYGPYDAWNPRGLWLVVVLVSGFSLAGYVAARLFGPSRGTIATAAAGSVVSSTAVTAAIAGRLKQGERGAIFHASVMVASAVMFLRVMALAGALAPFALEHFAWFAVPGMLASLLLAGWFLIRARREPPPESGTLGVSNPFAIGPALLLMALVMVMTLAAHWVLDRFGDAGLATVLALSGVVDVDSAIITMGSLPQGAIRPEVAGLVLVAPVVLNTLFKAGTLYSIAGGRSGLPGALALLAAAVAAMAPLPFAFGW